MKNRIKLSVKFGDFDPEGDGSILCDTFLLIGARKKEGNNDGEIFVIAKDGKEDAEIMIIFIFWAIHLASFLMRSSLDDFFKELIVGISEKAFQKILVRKDIQKEWLPSQVTRYFSNN